MKVVIKLGDLLRNSEVPKTVPVICGLTTESITAIKYGDALKLDGVENLEDFEVGLSGAILERKDNVITKFKIESVSIVEKWKGK